jgi:hypothetical protein
MSLKSVLGKVLLFGVLQLGALAGVAMTPQKIEELMEVMNRVQVTRVVHKEGSKGPHALRIDPK